MIDVMLSAFQATRRNRTCDQALHSSMAGFWDAALGNPLAASTGLLVDLAALDSDLRFDFCDCGLDVDDEESDHVVIVGSFPSQRHRVRVTFQVVRRSLLETLVRLGSQAVKGWKQMTVFVMPKS